MLQRIRCGLRLHAFEMLCFEDDNRLSLLCAECGVQSPGWELNETPPTITCRPDKGGQALSVASRRIA